jgi:hypothetical protein
MRTGNDLIVLAAVGTRALGGYASILAECYRTALLQQTSEEATEREVLLAVTAVLGAMLATFTDVATREALLQITTGMLAFDTRSAS